MAKVQIFVDDNESYDQVEEDLIKALGHHVSGEVHAEDKFDDPATNEAAELIQKLHETAYKQMLSEIFSILDEDLRRDNQ